MMRRSISITGLLFVILAITGCAALQQINETRRVIETCEFSLRSIKPSIDIKGPKVSLTGIESGSVNIVFALDIAVRNTTDTDLSFNRVDLRVYVKDQLVATGTTSKSVSLPAGQTGKLPATVDVDPEQATKQLRKTLKGKNVRYRVDGTFYFRTNGWDIPITVTLKE
ncbi:LEA type 2 family protein [Candidatus Neomarinimicrobiota bacterium]